jgi:nucleotide-binding universal stress UspA family protein
LIHHVPPTYLQATAGDGSRLSMQNSELHILKKKMNEIIDEVRREGVLCEPVFLTGAPAGRIPAFVKARGVSRVIVATRIESDIERPLDGSLAEDLMVSLEIPVYTIGPHAQRCTARGPRPRQVLLATSFRPGSSVCTGFASAFAELYDAQLMMLHILDAGGMSEYQRVKARDAARQKLSTYIPTEIYLKHPPVITVHDGDPATAILERAGSSPEDLIVLGSPSSSLVSRILAGNVVHQVITKARCPVVTIKPTASTVRNVIRESFDREYHVHF